MFLFIICDFLTAHARGPPLGRDSGAQGQRDARGDSGPVDESVGRDPRSGDAGTRDAGARQEHVATQPVGRDAQDGERDSGAFERMGGNAEDGSHRRRSHPGDADAGSVETEVSWGEVRLEGPG